jgi:hypothetical protein
MEPKEHDEYYVIGELKSGGGFYISRHRRHHLWPRNGRTTRKADAWRMSRDQAEDMVQRFHHVQAQGHYHQDVFFYRVARAPKRRRRQR